jgi:hemolysin D
MATTQELAQLSLRAYYAYGFQSNKQGVVSIVSQDAVPDEKRGLLFQARVKLKQYSLDIDGKTIAMSPGMNDYFLDTVKKTVHEGLRGR